MLKRQIENCDLKDEIRNTNRKPLGWTNLQLRLRHTSAGHKVLVFIFWKTCANKMWVVDFTR